MKRSASTTCVSSATSGDRLVAELVGLDWHRRSLLLTQAGSAARHADRCERLGLADAHLAALVELEQGQEGGGLLGAAEALDVLVEDERPALNQEGAEALEEGAD